MWLTSIRHRSLSSVRYADGNQPHPPGLECAIREHRFHSPHTSRPRDRSGLRIRGDFHPQCLSTPQLIDNDKQRKEEIGFLVARIGPGLQRQDGRVEEYREYGDTVSDGCWANNVRGRPAKDHRSRKYFRTAFALHGRRFTSVPGRCNST